MIDPTAHLGDAISALLDGELDPVEAEQAHTHLQACAACAAEYDGVAAVRAGVRGLPFLDPPFGLIERLVIDERRRERWAGRRRMPVWLAGGAAAAALLVLAAAPRHSGSVQPPVATFVDAHAAASLTGDPVSGLAPVAIPVSFSSPSSTPSSTPPTSPPAP